MIRANVTGYITQSEEPYFADTAKVYLDKGSDVPKLQKVLNALYLKRNSAFFYPKSRSKSKS